MEGFKNLRLTGEVVSELSGGSLVYSAPELTFDHGPFHGSGWLKISDENYQFEAEIDVPLTGLPGSATVPLRRAPSDTDNPVYGSKTWAYRRTVGSGQISGELTATLGRGSLDIRGDARYTSRKPKINGTVTIIVDSFDKAKQAITTRLGPDAPGSIAPAGSGETLAIAGYGQLDFAFSSWMTGNAEMILHPEGYVTARGELLPNKVIQLARRREKSRTLVDKEITRVIAGIPGLGDVRAKGSAALKAYGRFGPGTLHDIRLSGLLSNHPDIVNRFDLAGTISAPAAVGLTLTAEASLSAYLAHLKKMGEMWVSGRGNLELQMYAEAAAAVGRRAGKSAGGEPEYYLEGDLAASAALNLDLHLGMGGSVLFLAGKIDLFEQTYNLGSGGAKLSFDYVIGRPGGSITTDLGAIDFDPGAFIEAVVRGDTVTEKGYTGEEGVEGKTTSSVVNPDAPTPSGPAGPLAPGTTDPTAADRLIEEPFDMMNEPHTLRLALVDPPALDMASKTPTRLLRRIKTERTRLRKDPGPHADIAETRMRDLDKIEESAEHVLAAAAKINKKDPYLSPKVPGFVELAALISGYAARHQATDLAAGWAGVSVDPAKPETVLHKFPALAADPLIVARVARLMESGIDASVLRKIADNHQPRQAETLVDLLQFLETMIVNGAVNWSKVVEDLAIGGNKLQGARFVLKFIDQYRSWDAIMFEETAPARRGRSGRVWDAWISGTLHEFKSWRSWVNDTTFLKQMLVDYTEIISQRKLPMLWVFDSAGMSRDEILGHMRTALDRVADDLRNGREPKVPGYTLKRCEAIKSRLDGIVSLAKFPTS